MITNTPRPRTVPSSAILQPRHPCLCSTRQAKRFPSSSTIREGSRFWRLPVHTSATSVIAPHNISFMFIQATVAILILVGFESVTSMGGEAKNPTKHIPIAVIASLLIQGLVCYLIEYFAANYFLNSGYTMASASSSAAPIAT